MAFNDMTNLPQGEGNDIRFEAGCWTQGSTTDVSIPSHLTKIISLVTESADGSCMLTEAAEISLGYITGSTNETTSGIIINYVAAGW